LVVTAQLPDLAASTALGEKILHIRKVEGLSQQEFCNITGAGLSAIKNLEAGSSDNLNTKTLFAITNHPRFKKYAVYLISDIEERVEQEVPLYTEDEFYSLLNCLNEEEVAQSNPIH
jgi:transcriptional regulator with XRE-family HTH domain